MATCFFLSQRVLLFVAKNGTLAASEMTKTNLTTITNTAAGHTTQVPTEAGTQLHQPL